MSSWIYFQVFFYWSRHLSYGEIKMIQIFHHFARILNQKKSLPWQCGQILVRLLKVLQKAKKKREAENFPWWVDDQHLGGSLLVYFTKLTSL